VEAKASNLKASRRPTLQKGDGGWHGESTGNRRHVLPELYPKALARWYREHLGITPVAGNYDERGWEQQALPTGFAPFPETASTSAMPESNAWPIFASVIWTRWWRNLNAAGIAVEPNPEPYPNVRFARLCDPEGIAIELWQPAGRDAR